MWTESLSRALADGGGLVMRRLHPELGSALDRALRAGLVQRVLPGCYAPTGDLDLVTRARAAVWYDPDSVVTGTAAAALTWWPEAQAPVLEVASRAHRTSFPGFRWHQQVVPAEHVVELDGLRVSDALRTVLDTIPSLGGAVIDEALRRRVVTLADLEARFAAMPPRPGDAVRRMLFDDSRDEPWSEAERRLHGIMRSVSLPCGFHTNFLVVLADGTIRYVDVALPDLLLGFEVDGFEFHGTRRAFGRDRASDAELATLSWQRIRFEADDIFQDEAWVRRIVSEVVAAREALFRGLRPG